MKKCMQIIYNLKTICAKFFKITSTFFFKYFGASHEFFQNYGEFWPKIRV